MSARHPQRIHRPQLPHLTTHMIPMPNNNRFARTALLGALLFVGAAAFAQSTGRLYDPLPPDDSAYVRAVLVPPAADGPLMLDGKSRVAKLSARTPGEYLVVSSGPRQLQVKPGGKAWPTARLDAAERGAYTVIFPSASAKPYVFTDKTSTNRLKAMLAVYHVAPGIGAVDVTTADGKTKVFAQLKPGAPAILEVNPIEVSLQVTAAGSDKPLATVALAMERGGAYSIFLFPAAGGKLAAVAQRNQRERYTGD